MRTETEHKKCTPRLLSRWTKANNCDYALIGYKEGSLGPDITYYSQQLEIFLDNDIYLADKGLYLRAAVLVIVPLLYRSELWPSHATRSGSSLRGSLARGPLSPSSWTKETQVFFSVTISLRVFSKNHTLFQLLSVFLHCWCDPFRRTYSSPPLRSTMKPKPFSTLKFYGIIRMSPLKGP